MTYSSDSTDPAYGSNRPPFLRTAAGSLQRWLTAVGDAVAYVLHWRHVNWTIKRLSSLDDATLRDIGIGRSEIVPTAYRMAQDAWESRRREGPTS